MHDPIQLGAEAGRVSVRASAVQTSNQMTFIVNKDCSPSRPSCCNDLGVQDGAVTEAVARERELSRFFSSNPTDDFSRYFGFVRVFVHDGHAVLEQRTADRLSGDVEDLLVGKLVSQWLAPAAIDRAVPQCSDLLGGLACAAVWVGKAIRAAAEMPLLRPSPPFTKRTQTFGDRQRVSLAVDACFQSFQVGDAT